MNTDNQSTNQYKEIEWEDFIAKFKPLKNPLDDNASYDGFMLETYGEEFALVQATAVDEAGRGRIWTVVDDGDESNLVSGLHYVNRLGYVITEAPCPVNEIVTVL